MISTIQQHNLKRKREQEIPKYFKSHRSNDEVNSSHESELEEKNKKNWGNLSNSDEDVFAIDNHIYFKGDVNKENVYKLREELQNISRNYSDSKINLPGLDIMVKPIYLHLNTYGGYLDAGWVAVDFIQNLLFPYILLLKVDALQVEHL